MKLSELTADFLIAKEVEEGCSQNTIKAYRYDLAMFQHELNDPFVDRIRTLHVRRFLKMLYERNYTKRALARKIACLKSFFKFCQENDMIEKNPMDSVKSPKRADPPQ